MLNVLNLRIFALILFSILISGCSIKTTLPVNYYGIKGDMGYNLNINDTIAVFKQSKYGLGLNYQDTVKWKYVKNALWIDSIHFLRENRDTIFTDLKFLHNNSRLLLIVDSNFILLEDLKVIQKKRLLYKLTDSEEWRIIEENFGDTTQINQLFEL